MSVRAASVQGIPSTVSTGSPRTSASMHTHRVARPRGRLDIDPSQRRMVFSGEDEDLSPKGMHRTKLPEAVTNSGGSTPDAT